jgi:hypothetical protein
MENSPGKETGKKTLFLLTEDMIRKWLTDWCDLKSISSLDQSITNKVDRSTYETSLPNDFKYSKITYPLSVWCNLRNFKFDKNYLTYHIRLTSTSTNNHVVIFCPEKREHFICNIEELIPSRSSFGAFSDNLLSIVGFDKERIKIVRRNSEDWLEELSYGREDSMDIIGLKVGDLLEVRRLIANVGGRFLLSTLMNEDKYNKLFCKHIKSLETNYVGFQRIRGDGNCYYRAVIYGLLEVIVQSKQWEKIEHLKKVFENLTFEDNEFNLQHQKMLKQLTLAKGSCFRNSFS